MTKSTSILVGLSLVVAMTAWANSAPLNIEKALTAQYQLVTERPNDPSVHNDLGNLLSLMDRFGEAESAYRKAKELDPVEPSVRFNLGLLLQQTGRLEDANQEYYSLLELEPKHAWAHYQLGTVAYAQGKIKSAKELYARSFAIDPALSFSKHNPHVIDNPLATEALLMSSRFMGNAVTRVPRQYAEASRIADLILEEEEEDDMRVAQGETEERASEPQPVQTLGASEEGDSRVLTNEDLSDLGASGQAGNRNSRARASSRYSTSSRSSSSSRYSGTSRGGAAYENAATASPKDRENNTPRSRYRPGSERKQDREELRNNRGNRLPGGVVFGQPGAPVQPQQKGPGNPGNGASSGNGGSVPEDGSVPSIQRRRFTPGSSSTASVRLEVLGNESSLGAGN